MADSGWKMFRDKTPW